MAFIHRLILYYQPYPNIERRTYYTPMFIRDKQGTFPKNLLINKIAFIILLLTNSSSEKEINKKMILG